MKKLRSKLFLFFFSLTIVLAGCFRAPLSKLPTANAPLPLARAELPQTGTYACILREDVFFYATADENRGLFLLPATYYVKLVDYGVDFCRAEYLYDNEQSKKLIGYVKTEHLTFVDYVPKQPYFYHTFDLNYRIDETVSESSDFLNQITVSCTYYGDYKIGSKTYCYVLRGEAFGYVPRPAGLTVRENTEYADRLTEQAPPQEEPPKKENASSPAQIAILIALCLLVPVLAALILKPPRRPPYETE